MRGMGRFLRLLLAVLAVAGVLLFAPRAVLGGMYARIEPCEHENATFQCTDAYYHQMTCAYCLAEKEDFPARL